MKTKQSSCAQKESKIHEEGLKKNDQKIVKRLQITDISSSTLSEL